MAGTQNISHLAPVLLFARAGIDLVMIPAKSEPQAISDLIAGQVDLYFGNSSSLLPHIDSDKIRLIAVGTAQRHPRSAGHSGRGGDYAGLRVRLVEWLSPRRQGRRSRSSRRSGARSRRFAKSPEVSERLSKLGIIPGGLTKEQTEAVFKKDHESFAAAIKAAGIAPPQ